jgi:sulfatase modifying factor 1
MWTSCWRGRGHVCGVVAALLALASCVSGEMAEDAWVGLPGGRFAMGDPEGEPDEAPKTFGVAPFRLMRHEVTNRQFAAFVEASGHVTDAEGHGFGWVWPGRWTRVEGANWRHPSGPGSDIEGRDDHPVVQVSARDAAAFCAHHGWRLPIEAEWEFAARGTDRRRYPWGNETPAQPSGLANFGTVACCAADAGDGISTTAPVGRFEGGASPFGLLDMAGNVWEWTASPYPPKPEWVSLRGGGWGNDPYCLRTSYRHGNPPDIGLDMVGFRCATDAATP